MQELLEELKDQNKILLEENEQIKQDKFLLEEKVKDLEYRLFGRKSEKIKDESPELFNEAEYIQEKESEHIEKETITYVRKKKKGGRRKLPDHLPRITIVHDIPEEEKQCACGYEMKKIAEEVSERLRYIPAVFEVEKHIRLKYACKNCEGTQSEGIHPAVKIAPTAPSILPKTFATPGLFANIIINKFCDALPFYRQEKIFKRHNIDLTRSMMARWAVMGFENMRIFFECLYEELLKSYFIGIDETRVQVLNEPDKTPESMSFMWVYRGVTDKEIILIYQYDPSRSGKVPDEYLKKYKGKIQTDGYGGYNRLAKSKDIIRYGCWAHARRKFIDAINVGGDGGIARQFVDLIGILYQVEKDLREGRASPEDITAIREKKSLPIIMQIKKTAEEKKHSILPKSKLGIAVNYLLGEWENLDKYIYDGYIPIDNNYVENAIRPFVVGRRNWLFYDTQDGAKASAGYYSIIETAKANCLEPYSYLNYLFEKIPIYNEKSDFQKLLPMNIDRSIIKTYELPKSSRGR
jgi:transposase